MNCLFTGFLVTKTTFHVVFCQSSQSAAHYQLHVDNILQIADTANSCSHLMPLLMNYIIFYKFALLSHDNRTDPPLLIFFPLWAYPVVRVATAVHGLHIDMAQLFMMDALPDTTLSS